MAELNSSQKPGDDSLTSGLFGSDVFSFDIFDSADENVKSSISDLVADCQPAMEMETFEQPAKAAPAAPAAPAVPAAPVAQPVPVPVASAAPSALSVTIPAEKPVQVAINRSEDSVTIGLETAASEPVIPVAAKPIPITLPQTATQQPIAAPVPQPQLNTQPLPPISIIPELASLSTPDDEVGYGRFAAPDAAPEPDFIPIVIPAPPAPPVAAPAVAPVPVPQIAAPAQVALQDLSVIQQGEQPQQPVVQAPDPSPQLTLDLTPPRQVVTEPAPEIAAIAVTQAPPVAVPPTPQYDQPALVLPEPIAVLKPAPVPQPSPILEPAPLPEPVATSPQATVLSPVTPVPVPVPAPQSVPVATPAPQPLPQPIKTAGPVEIDDSEIEPVEPASDWRWQGNEILLPLDRPLPKVEGQRTPTTPVTPVQEIPVATPQPQPAPVPVPVPQPAPVATPTQQPAAITAPFPAATPTQTPAATSAPIPTPQVAPVAAPTPQVAPAPQPAPTGQLTPAAAPAPTPVPQSAPVAAPVLQPAPTVLPSASAHVSAIPASVAAAYSAHEVVTPLPVTPVGSPAQGGALIKDEALDIDDSDDGEYYEEEDEGKTPYSGPRFIVILIIILVLEMFFVGLLVSLGVLDPSEIGAFWSDLFS